MRRLMIGVVLGALVVCGAVQAQDIGWPPAPVAKTGQTTCYDTSGSIIACAGTGQDGDLIPGTAWPSPRFTDNSDGTVTDNLTGLIWLKNANCTVFFGGDVTGHNARPWADALEAASYLTHGYCQLLDGSVPGNWRLPSRFELESLLNLEYNAPALSDAAGTGQWSEDDAFSGVQGSSFYWSSTTNVVTPHNAWWVFLGNGWVDNADKTSSHFVWPVRDGAPVFADGFGPGDGQQWSAEVP
jgi:hypothetical protein